MIRTRPANSIRDGGCGLNQSPDLWLQSSPSYRHRLSAWQNRGDHLCCARFPCVHAAATTPAQRLGFLLRSCTQSCQPSPLWQPGRPAHRPFRGLLGVHSRCGLHTRAVTVFRDTLYPKASAISSPPCLLRLLPAGAVAGWGLHPLESAALSRRTPEAVGRRNLAIGCTANASRTPSPRKADRRPDDGHRDERCWIECNSLAKR